jgi:hypothetical protein
MATSNRAWEEETRKYLTEVKAELKVVEKKLDELMAKRNVLTHEAEAYETALQSYLNRTGRQKSSTSDTNFKDLLLQQNNMKDRLKRIAERENGVIKVGAAANILFNFGLIHSKSRMNAYRVVYGLIAEMTKEDIFKKIAPSTFRMVGSQERLPTTSPHVIVGKPIGVFPHKID